MFRFTPQMREMIKKAKATGKSVTCDPRANYPIGHPCAPTTQPVGPPRAISGKPLPPWAGGTTQPVTRLPKKSVPLIYDPERFRRTIDAPTTGVVTDAQAEGDGGATITTQGDNGDTVTASVDRNGAVREVTVRPKLFENPLVPIALGAAALLLLGG